MAHGCSTTKNRCYFVNLTKCGKVGFRVDQNQNQGNLCAGIAATKFDDPFNGGLFLTAPTRAAHFVYLLPFSIRLGTRHA